MNKPHLRIVNGAPVVVPALSTKVQEARERHGKPFGTEPGTDFKWQSGPTILNEWLHGRKSK